MTITTLITICIVCAALALALKTLNTKKRGGSLDYSVKWPYRKRRTLLTLHEQPLYYRLREALPEYLIFSQVQLSQILEVEKGNYFGAWLGRIGRMSVDFVVCTKSTEIVALIELDDFSHDIEDRRKADQKKDKACADAGIPLIRWRWVPEKNEIRKTLGL